MAGPERDETRQLLKHWKRFRGDKRLPDQDDIRLEELADLIPYLFTIDIESDDRFIVRRLGKAVRERFNGIDITGLNLLDFTPPAFRQRMQARVRLIFEFGYAACTHTGVPLADGRLKRTENLMLPVENTAGGFRQIFGTVFYADGTDAASHHTPSLEGVRILDESFIDLGVGYAAVIDASELPDSIFPGNPNP